MKYNGLSKNTIAKCRMLINVTIMCGNERMKRVGTCFLSYLSEEIGLLKKTKIVNNSSDLIETTFGILSTFSPPTNSMVSLL